MSLRVSTLVAASAFAWAALACDSAEAPELPDASSPPGGDAGVRDLGPEAPDAGLADGGTTVGSIRLDTDRVAFGQVVVGSTRTLSLFVENPGVAPAEVSLTPPSGSSAGAFARALPGGAAERFTVAPGARAEVLVTVAPAAPGELVATLALDACAGGCPVAVLLTATGVDAGLRCDARLELGLVNLGTCREGQVACVNEANLEERVTQASVDGDAAFALAAPFVPLTVAPGSTATVAVQLCPSAAGAVRSTLELDVAPSAMTGTAAVRRSVALRGEGGGADVACAPASLDFGTVAVGVPVVRELTCANRGLDAARLVSTLAAPEFRLASAATATIPPGSSTLVRVEIAAVTAGAKQGRLQITTNDPDTPRLEVPLEAEARDVVPCQLRARPGRLELGQVPLGASIRASVALENLRNQDCVLRSVGLAPGASSDLELSSPPPSTVPAGGRVEVGLGYAPTAAGTVSTALEVRFDDGVTPPLDVPVTASAAAAELLAAPASVDFGAHPVGCGRPASRVIEVHRLAGAGSITRVALTGAATAAFSLSGVGALPNRLEAGQTLALAVEFDPPAAGPYDAELRVFAGAAATLVIPLRGEGQAGLQRTETWRRSPRQVDVLFVVDDSGSMGPAQGALAAAAPAIVAHAAEVDADLHIGVITTDLEDPSTAGALVGNPAFLTRQSPGLVTALAERLAPGIDGSGTEQGVAAAARAVTAPLAGGANGGFLRSGADLAVIVVSDEADASPGAVAQAALALRSAAGQGRLSVHALTGPPSGPACDGPLGDADPAPRYAALARLTGGRVESLCADLQAGLGRILDVALGARTLALGAEPAPSSIELRIDGRVVPRHAPPAEPGGFAWAVDDRALRLFAPDQLPARGTVEARYDVACVSSQCGDGVTQPPEQCDDGNRATTDACVACVDASCGDRLVWSGNEACDDGNLDPTDGCLPSCQEARCGDGFVEAGVEDCDDGNTTPGDGCPSTCRFYSVSGPSFRVFERLRTGRVLSFSGGSDPEDEGVATVTLPFVFEFFGVPTSTLTVSPNGVVGVGSGPRESFRDNARFPDARAPNGVIAPWWDDLVIDPNVSRQGASVAFEVFGRAPNRTAVIQWRDLRLEDQSTRGHRRWRFQLQIDEATSELRFHYGDTEQRGFNFPSSYSASVGLESVDGRVGVTGLACSPDCDGRPRRLRPDFHFPESEVIVFTPQR